MKHLNQEQDNESEDEGKDYSAFYLMEAVRQAGIETICLDECHHLRNEWWNALEEFMVQAGKVRVISLTATPPYDSTPAQWERYITMCGEIDEEIFVPELVQDHSLCPHQDYVYFNYPSKKERAQAAGFRLGMDLVLKELLADERFAELVQSHKGIAAPALYADTLLDSPPYLASILIFMEYKKYQYPPEWLRILGVRKLPVMNMKYMEQLLQGVIFDDPDSYEDPSGYRTELTEWLKTHKAIDKRKISITANSEINKMLINSIGKLDSIYKIVCAEYRSMGKELHLLILTDYIRKEYLESIGKPDRAIEKIGVVPVFEYLRRNMGAECRLGVLCGGLVILPEEAAGHLQKMAERELGSNKQVLVEMLEDAKGGALGYMKVNIRGNNQDIVKIITQVFEAGYVQVMVGTQALLGEGWDSPCINSLILASFVGSFVLSNQMRGRAIRTYQPEPGKTSNIWHLVCLETGLESEVSRLSGIGEERISEDYAMLCQRMKGFLGVSYSGDAIENGIDRLGLKKNCYTRQEVDMINRDMINRAMDRDSLREKWNQATAIYDRMEVVDENEFPREMLKPGVRFFNLIGWGILNIAVDIFYIMGSVHVIQSGGGRTARLIFQMISILFVILSFRILGKLTTLMTPLARLREIGNGMLAALDHSGQIQSQCKVVVDDQSGFCLGITLFGGTIREKDIFATCMEQFLGEIDNQRYILYSRKKWKQMQNYYCVPTVFAGRKEHAEMFRKKMERFIGNYDLVYTRNEAGRRILYKARRGAYGNRIRFLDQMADRKKKVKGALE